MPLSNVPRSRPGAEELDQRVHVRPGGRHGTTIRATGERVQDRPRAGVSSATDAGEQTSSRRRLGVSPGPVALNGPTMVICEMPGMRVSAWKTLSAPTTRVRTIIAAATVCGPAGHANPRGAFGLQRDPLPIQRHVTVVDRRRPPPRGPPSARHAATANLELVLGVERKGVAEDDAAAGAERQAVDVDVLFEVTRDAIGNAVQADRSDRRRRCG